MASRLLTVVEVMKAADGDHVDGEGLLLRVRKGNASFVHRYTGPTGKRREMGLGKCARSASKAAGAALVAARAAADDNRAMIRRGLDPIDARDANREQARAAASASKAAKVRERQTFARVARQYHETEIEPSRTEKHGATWISSLEQHVPPEVWHKPIADVTAPELYEWLVVFQRDKAETARRVRQRLDSVFEHAVFLGLCPGNPAAGIKRKLANARGDVEVENLARLHYAKIPQLFCELAERAGPAARALEFSILTASRTGEVIEAEWSEFDLDAATWVIPFARLKQRRQRRDHQVHLSAPALAIIKGQQGVDPRWVFASPDKPGEPLSNMAMLMLLQRRMGYPDVTVHGTARGGFSTWAYETGAGRGPVIEAALGHAETNKVKAAYNHAQYLPERKALLDAWGRHCLGTPLATVVDLAEHRAQGAA